MLFRLFKALIAISAGTFGGLLAAGSYEEKYRGQDGFEIVMGVRIGAGFLAGLTLACRRFLPHGPWRWVAASSVIGAAAAPTVVDRLDGTGRSPKAELEEYGDGAIVGSILGAIGLLAGFWLHNRKKLA